MSDLGAYVFRICAAALLCAVAERLCGRDKAVATVVRTVSGLFLVFTLLHPLSALRTDRNTDLFGDFSVQAQEAVQIGTDESRNSFAQCIKEQIEAYILDKAQAYGAGVEVSVTLSSDALPTPVGVTVCGAVSPYARQQLKHLLEEDLGIAEENQVWTQKK